MAKSDTPNLNLDEAKQAGEEHIDALYQHVKDKASELYEESKKTVSEAQDSLKECTDSVVTYVKEKPITSILIAGGIGFILSSLLKK